MRTGDQENNGLPQIGGGEFKTGAGMDGRSRKFGEFPVFVAKKTRALGQPILPIFLMLRERIHSVVERDIYKLITHYINAASRFKLQNIRSYRGIIWHYLQLCILVMY